LDINFIYFGEHLEWYFVPKLWHIKFGDNASCAQ